MKQPIARFATKTIGLATLSLFVVFALARCIDIGPVPPPPEAKDDSANAPDETWDTQSQVDDSRDDGSRDSTSYGESTSSDDIWDTDPNADADTSGDTLDGSDTPTEGSNGNGGGTCGQTDTDTDSDTNSECAGDTGTETDTPSETSTSEDTGTYPADVDTAYTSSEGSDSTLSSDTESV